MAGNVTGGKAEKLLEINKLLTQSLELNEILKNVIYAAKELIDVSDTLIIYLFDENSGTLRFAEGEGVDYAEMEKLSFAPGESITGKVYVERKPMLFFSKKDIDSCMGNMTSENFHHYFNGVFRREIKSAFSVPIINKDYCFGVLVVDNFRHDGVFSKADMEVIEMVADLTAIALDNAKLYMKLQQKNELLSQSLAVHNSFYKLIIKGGGMEEILTLLKKNINSQVVFHKNNSVLNSIEEAEGLYYPIVRGNEVLGHFQLEMPFHQYGKMEQIAIEHASSAAALELVKENALYEKELHFREEVFNQILEGLSPSELNRALKFMNWEENWNLQCVVVENRAGQLWENNRISDKEWFVRSVEDTSKSINSLSLVFTKAYMLVIIIPVITGNTASRIIKQIQGQWKGEKDLVFGVGRETTIHDLPLSFQEAVKSVACAKEMKQSIVQYSKLGIERLIYELDPSVAKIFTRDKLKGLLDIEAVYMKTLASFVENNRNSRETAEALHIHPNTLYYRLKKIEQILETDFKDEKSWLEIVFALKLHVADHKE